VTPCFASAFTWALRKVYEENRSKRSLSFGQFLKKLEKQKMKFPCRNKTSGCSTPKTKNKKQPPFNRLSHHPIRD